MRVIRAGAKPAFGVLVIAHGLAHARLPIDEWLDSGRLSHDSMPLILFTVAVLGFVAGGLGVVGLRPFASVARQAMVLASAYSLVLIWRFGQGDLWWGASVDAVLFLTGLTGAYRHLPDWHETPVTQVAAPASPRG